MSEAEVRDPEGDARSEWMKFGIFVGVLIAVLLIIALTRPLIFGRIIPSILEDPNPEGVVEETDAPAAEEGESLDNDAEAPAAEPEEANAPEEEADNGDDPAVEPEAEEDDPNVGGGGPAVEESEPAEELEEEPEAAVSVEEVDETTDEAAEETEPAAEETADSPNTTQHTVQPGENLTRIANAYSVSVQQIIDANELPNPNRISAGTVLNIPQP